MESGKMVNNRAVSYGTQDSINWDGVCTSDWLYSHPMRWVLKDRDSNKNIIEKKDSLGEEIKSVKAFDICTQKSQR
jgi:hypothetical protein